MGTKSDKEEKIWLVPRKRILLVSIYHLRGKGVLIKTKNKIEYFGVFFNLDNNLNLLLSKTRVFLERKKRTSDDLKYYEKIVLNGNKITMIIPVNLKQITN